MAEEGGAQRLRKKVKYEQKAKEEGVQKERRGRHGTAVELCCCGTKQGGISSIGGDTQSQGDPTSKWYQTLSLVSTSADSTAYQAIALLSKCKCLPCTHTHTHAHNAHTPCTSECLAAQLRMPAMRVPAMFMHMPGM
eukprot:1156437-Pelagomonas_calceolata.AAC.7